MDKAYAAEKVDQPIKIEEEEKAHA
jgi:hypothetical protein